MGGACSTYGETRDVYSVWWGNLSERDHLDDPDVDGRLGAKRIVRRPDLSVQTGECMCIHKGVMLKYKLVHTRT